MIESESSNPNWLAELAGAEHPELLSDPVLLEQAKNNRMIRWGLVSALEGPTGDKWGEAALALLGELFVAARQEESLDDQGLYLIQRAATNLEANAKNGRLARRARRLATRARACRKEGRVARERSKKGVDPSTLTFDDLWQKIRNLRAVPSIAIIVAVVATFISVGRLIGR